MQAVRPLSVSAALDLVLAHPQWRDRVDPDRIGGFGASQGGETMMLLGGAELTTSIFLSTKRVTKDERLKARRRLRAVLRAAHPAGVRPRQPRRRRRDAAVPRDQRHRGHDGADRPRRGRACTGSAGTRELVALTGLEHGLDPAAASDIFTWSLEWVDAMVKDDRAARARVMRMEQVAGGVEDIVRIDYIVPAAEARGRAQGRSSSTTRRSITTSSPPSPRRSRCSTQGVIVPGWQRTGFEFKSWTPGSAVGRRGLPLLRHAGPRVRTRTSSRSTRTNARW